MTGVSVLTLVRGRAGHFANLVEGLRRSARAPDELIVVDMNDAPIEPPTAPFPVHVRRIGARGLALAAARNCAARAARCEHLLFLDVDCIPACGLIEAMRSALTLNDALICADVRYLGPDDARGAWSEADLLSAGAAHPARRFPSTGLAVEPEAGLFWSLAFGVRRARFEQLGGFDERFTGYGGEDTDLGFRAREAGLPLLMMAGPGAFHQHHPVSDPPIEHVDDIIRNAVLFRAKWGTWPMLGWLESFERLGLLKFENGGLRRLAPPSRM